MDRLLAAVIVALILGLIVALGYQNEQRLKAECFDRHCEHGQPVLMPRGTVCICAEVPK